MVKKTITVELETGLEARPIAMLVQVASQYDSKIYMETGNTRVNAKSIMGMMTLVLPVGQEITVKMCIRDRCEDGHCMGSLYVLRKVSGRNGEVSVGQRSGRLDLEKINPESVGITPNKWGSERKIEKMEEKWEESRCV